MKKPLRIFIVYAREDSAYKDDLIKALSPLKNQGWVESWHDGDIRPGEAWDARIREQIEAADLILPLVSNDFFASEYIQNVEFHAAFERHQAGSCRIVPVIIRAGEWTADDRLAKLQALPEGGVPVGSWANRDEAFKSIAAGIRKLAQQEDWLPPIEAHPDKPRRTMSWRLPVFLIGSILAIFAAWNFAKKSAEAAAEKNISAAYRTAAATGTIPALRDFLKDCDSGPYADSARNAIMLFERKLDTLVLEAEALYKGGRTSDAYESLEHARRIDSSDSRVVRLRDTWR
ncbi:MAG: toll/interleukin-1 receptor domain-containing protein [Saprospiraceae bacterium]|jgi:hypothetical protein|nr:toll/interleukin-1 receptor domain-containing protein [Saprospiraceae bacterium]